MFEKLSEAERRYEEIQSELADPDVASDIERYRRLMKDEKNLAPVIEEYREYKRIKKEIADAEELISDSGDPELRELAELEYKDNRQKLAESEERLKMVFATGRPSLVFRVTVTGKVGGTHHGTGGGV